MSVGPERSEFESWLGWNWLGWNALSLFPHPLSGRQDYSQGQQPVEVQASLAPQELGNPGEPAPPWREAGPERPQCSPASPLLGLGPGGMCRREVQGGGPGAGRKSLGGRAASVTQEGGRAWLRAHHSASCLPQARNPGGLSSPLPACWDNIVISPMPPAWDGLVLCAAQGHRAGGRQGYGEVTRCLEDDSGLECCKQRG